MRAAALLLGLALAAAPAPARAQDDQTLADIRQELSVLFVEIQRLKRELSTTGGAAVNVSGDLLQRVELIESELKRLTAETEELSFRIEQVVEDGTNRVGDLEFRLCELEADCDIADLGDTPRLGGVEPRTAPPPEPETEATTTEMAVGEQADFDAAKAALDAGDHAEAAELFATFLETYPGGPLSGQAHYYRGVALSEQGETTAAARAFLESFSGSPDGPRAPDALLRLGVALHALDQTDEACLMLSQVGERYPSSSAAVEATSRQADFGCR